MSKDWESIKGCVRGKDLTGKTVKEKMTHVQSHIDNARRKER